MQNRVAEAMVKDVDFWSHTLVLQVRGEMPGVRGVRGDDGAGWEPVGTRGFAHGGSGENLMIWCFLCCFLEA